MALSKIAERFEALGCKAAIADGGINLDVEGKEIFIDFNGEWLAAIRSFYRARQYHFDEECRVLLSNRSAEYLVVRLDPGFFHQVKHEFSDNRDNRVSVCPASKEFLLAYLESNRYMKS